MQIKKFVGLRPILLASSLSMVTSGSLYADVDKYTNITTVVANREMSQYIQFLCAEDAFEDSMIKKRSFMRYYERWSQETSFLSSAKAIIDHEDFKSIVSMGKDAVPYILAEIKENPSHLVWALNLIFNRKISDRQNLTITEACKLWVKELK